MTVSSYFCKMTIFCLSGLLILSLYQILLCFSDKHKLKIDKLVYFVKMFNKMTFLKRFLKFGYFAKNPYYFGLNSQPSPYIFRLDQIGLIVGQCEKLELVSVFDT